MSKYKYNLEEFVDVCNACTYQVSKNPGSKDGAFCLGKDFRTLCECKTEDEIEEANVSDDSRAFFKCLLEQEDSSHYKFNQNEKIIAEINVFEPFTKEGILDQKWHVLISLLALLDTAYFDNNYVGTKNFGVKGGIESIQVDSEIKKICISWTDAKNKIRTTSYPSELMNEWILEAIKENISKR